MSFLSSKIGDVQNRLRSKNVINILKALKDKLYITMPVALLFALNIFLFAPAAVYEKNINEFHFGFLQLFELYTMPLIVLLVLLIFLSFIISKSKIDIYISLLLALAVLFWLQGTFLGWNYGVFNGILIDWDQHRLHGWIDLFIWVSGLTLALVFSKKLFRACFIASMSLIFIQVVSLVVVSFSLGSGFWLKKYDIPMKYPESLTRYSNDLNIVHIVFDHFQTDVFSEIVKEESLEEVFDGFTVYKENMANVPITSYSIPAMLSGDVYNGEVSYDDYYNSTVKKSIPNYLFDKNFDVNLVPLLPLQKAKYTSYYEVPNVYGSSIEDERLQNADHLLEVSLFRYSPQFLKKLIYNDEKWLISTLLFRSPAEEIINHVNFFKDYIFDIKKGGSKPAYHFIHLRMPHPPYVLDQNGNYNEGLGQTNRDSYKNQAKYAVKLFLDLLKKIKDEGLYDNALIILCSDHGSEFRPVVKGVQIPMEQDMVPALLAVKPPHCRGRMQVSNAQTMVSDIPATIMNILGFETEYGGIPVVSANHSTERERIFVIPHNEESISRYVVRGSIYDLNSWTNMGQVSVKKKRYAYAWGDAINFGAGENSSKYKGKGWNFPLRASEWNGEKESSLIMTVEPPESDIKLTAYFSPFIHKKKMPRQRVIVSVNGHEVGEWLVDSPGFQTKTMLIPKFLITSNDLELTFKFPNAIPLRNLDINPDTRPLALEMHKIVLSKYNFSPERLAKNLFSKTANNPILDYENIYVCDNAVQFKGDGYVMVADRYLDDSDYMEFGLTFTVNEYPEEDTNWILRKFGPGWPENVSIVVGLQPDNTHIILSENGKDVDGIWLPPDYFKIGKTYNLLLVFDKGLVKMYVNNQEIMSKQLKIKKIYRSNLPITIGQGFKGSISDFYISYDRSHY